MVQAQANVTHFAGDEPFVELGDGPLESKCSQLLLPQGLLFDRENHAKISDLYDLCPGYYLEVDG